MTGVCYKGSDGADHVAHAHLTVSAAAAPAAASPRACVVPVQSRVASLCVSLFLCFCRACLSSVRACACTVPDRVYA